jgi:predicted nucleic acid-binding protein
MSHARWEEQVARLRRIAFDTNALIYLFEEVEPYASMVATAWQRVEAGQAVGVVSTIVEMELMVRPVREQDLGFLARLNLFLRHEPNIVVRSVDRQVARTAARVRAQTLMATPDALIAATAEVEACDAIIGNDAAFAKRSAAIPYLRLDNYAT